MSASVAMRGTGILAILFACLLADASAQADSTCTYEICALHVERTIFGSRIFRGQQGELVGVRGLPELFDRNAPRFDLITAVHASPAALVYAHRYERRSRTLRILGYAANGLFVVAMGEMLIRREIGGVGRTTGRGFIGLTVVSIPLSYRAERSFSRAIQEYNDSLPRAP